ncbi:histidine phosphatase family protein [Fibrobacter sp.]|uniref:histidine phosphatase family protein n=1 Tax=Fibrobacter sp. TaxID=35828 RepID=UPI00386E7FE3
MIFYFIRHAPTAANFTGSMVNGYDNADIVSMEKPADWEERIGKFVPRYPGMPIFCSPAKRCRQTAQMLFGDVENVEIIENDLFREFDCAGLGSRKFWEIDEAEFNACVNVTNTDMINRAMEILHGFGRQLERDFGMHRCVVVSHGMLIRYLYHFMTGNMDITPFDVIRSKGFKFANLDLLQIVDEPGYKCVRDYHFKPPVEHK